MQETILMGLRLTKEGLSREKFKARFGVDIVANSKKMLRLINMSNTVSLKCWMTVFD